MDGETVETVTGWGSESFSGGYAGLHDLAAREFTGAVTDGTAWLFVLNGRVVGVVDGHIESFADADGTAYAAPDPSLPLLFAMRESDGEVRGKYYTNDTPLSEVDETLSAGNFTGYVALSENVLSGDYYVVYHGGRSLACAFVGSSRRTITGDEAFERASDEVGIYEVREVDVSVTDVPEPPSSTAETGGAAVPDDGDEADPAEPTATGAAEGGTPDPDATAPDAADPTDDGADGRETDDGGAVAGEASDPPGGVTIDPTDDDPGAGPDSTDPGERPTGIEPDPDREAGDGVDGDGGGRDSEAGDGDPGGDDATEDPPVGVADGAAPGETTDAADAAETLDTSGTSGTSDAGGTGGSDDGRGGRSAGSESDPTAEPAAAASGDDPDPFSAEAQWRETRSIPSLDPDDAGTDPGGGGTDAADPSGADGDEPERPAETDDEPSSPAAGSGGTADPDGERSDTAALERARAARDEARSDLEDARAELKASESEAERLREENEGLRERVSDLEADLADAREELAAARERAPDVPTERAMSADDALAGTNLFVRYDSKSGATLEDARGGGATAGEVNANLRLERHTDFEAEGVAVDGRPFEEFLTDTVEYRFVEWAIRDLLYEIRETRNESSMRNLFAALPAIDRAELHGTVDLVDEEGKRDGDRSFDVVLRDRLGTPLVVADVTDSREPTTQSMLDGLVEGASAVADQQEDLSAAFYVSASFFEPGALEAAADATGGGLLTRGRHKSFVRLSRKRGFHLCLVEAREGEFHVAVPEL